MVTSAARMNGTGHSGLAPTRPTVRSVGRDLITEPNCAYFLLIRVASVVAKHQHRRLEIAYASGNYVL